MSVSVADSELKTRHRAMWASGDYPLMVETFLLPLGPRLVDACGITPGTRVLDVAAGTGNASIPAAQRGAKVTASDLTPELLEAGQRRPEAQGLDLEWVPADAEHLPFEDESFDVVISSIGVMFAPHHQDAADELVRVCRPGGTIGLLSWTPEGMLGALFARDEAVRAAAAARRLVAAAVGQRGAPARAVRRARRVRDAGARRARDHGVRSPARLRRALQGALRPDDRRARQRGARGARGRVRRDARRSSATRGRAGPTSPRASRRSTWSRSALGAEVDSGQPGGCTGFERGRRRAGLPLEPPRGGVARGHCRRRWTLRESAPWNRTHTPAPSPTPTPSGAARSRRRRCRRSRRAPGRPTGGRRKPTAGCARRCSATATGSCTARRSGA